MNSRFSVLFSVVVLTVIFLKQSFSKKQMNKGNYVSKLYERRPQTSVVFNLTKEVTSLDFVDCGVRCAGSTTCRAFCHSEALALCYLSGESGSPVSLLSDDTGWDCYSTGCSEDWGYTFTGGRCVKLHDEKLVYSAARDACNADGGHLYYFKSLEWDTQPLSDLGIPACVDCTAMWVGADDLQSEGDFVWSDGTPLVTSDTMWRQHEPNNANDNEDCVLLYMYTDPVLNDYQCHALRTFVCEMDV